MKRVIVLIIFFLALFLLSATAFADGGVLIPYLNGEQIEGKYLKLYEMDVRVQIDNGMVQVSAMQIYKSFYDGILEGEYEFIIPEKAELSGFAIWEDGVRIPGVILERWRAREIYETFKARMIDPGLMETDAESEINRFQCRVFPIMPFGTKRIELFYTQTLPVESESIYFFYPSTPTFSETQSVEHFRFNIDFKSNLPFKEPQFKNETLIPDKIVPHINGFSASFTMENVELTENIEIEIPIPVDQPEIQFISYRDIDRVRRDVSPFGGKNFKDDTGFFGARVLFEAKENDTDISPKQVVIALDTSLSMQWDKLRRALEVAYYIISNLREKDTFGILVFNSKIEAYQNEVQLWTEDTARQAEEWIRRRTIAGGTDFTKLFDSMAKQFRGDNRKIAVLLSDGAPTQTQLNIVNLKDSFSKSRLSEKSTRLFVVGIGGDVNRTFLTDIAKASGGPYIQLLPNENSARKSKVLLDWLDATMIENIRLNINGPELVNMYPQKPTVAFGGSSIDFVGKYNDPGKARAVVEYSSGGKDYSIERKIQFPEFTTEHEGLRRLWAKARILELLDMINREGEKKEWIEQIIALAKEFTFVTPYTSFLAAPRSLLRPRVIRPGDPILRVKTDPEIRRVVASFPFGLTRKMLYIPDEDIWQLRFLAPTGWPDGSYVCKLYLTDREGRRYIEDKRFVIDGRPPRVIPKSSDTFFSGTTVEILADADPDTRRLSAKIPFAGHCDLRYDSVRKLCVGTIELPADMPKGKHTIAWFAEDFAHNITRVNSEMEVVGHE